MARSGPDHNLRVGVVVSSLEAAALLLMLEGRPEVAIADPGEADVVLTDGPEEWAVPTVRIDQDIDDKQESEASLVTPGIDEATLLAVLRVAASGYRVRPAGRRTIRDLSEEPHADLTPREQAVLLLLADGASNKVIARQLGISPSTAKFHVASLLDKLGARNRLDAVAIGMRRGLVLV